MSPRLKAPPSWSLNEDSGVIARSALVLLLRSWWRWWGEMFLTPGHRQRLRVLSITSIGDMQEPKAESATLVEPERWPWRRTLPALLLSHDLELSLGMMSFYRPHILAGSRRPWSCVLRMRLPKTRDFIRKGNLSLPGHLPGQNRTYFPPSPGE